MICRLCHGRGNFFCMQQGKPEWWTCPACGGDGVRVMYGPKVIFIKSDYQQKMWNKKTKKPVDKK